MSETPKKLTVVQHVYHQAVDEEPYHYESIFETELKTQEEPYSRNCTAKESWKLLDCGWLGDEVGTLIISNKRTKFNTTPTDEEKEEAAKKTLELSYSKDKAYASWFIPPGESFRGLPNKPTKLFIRSLSGPLKYNITLIPS